MQRKDNHSCKSALQVTQSASKNGKKLTSTDIEMNQKTQFHEILINKIEICKF